MYRSHIIKGEKKYYIRTGNSECLMKIGYIAVRVL